SARDRLDASERHYRALAANSSDAVVLVGEDGLILSQSDTLAQLVGYPGVSTVGIDITLLVHRADVPDVRALLEKSLLAPGVVFETAVRVFHASGAKLWLGARLVNLIDDADVGGIVVNLR